VQVVIGRILTRFTKEDITMTTSEPPELTTKGFHDTLVRRVKDAMTVVGPEDLTIEELWAIVAVLEPAIGRQPADFRSATSWRWPTGESVVSRQ
jgi:hypothetical protein